MWDPACYGIAADAIFPRPLGEKQSGFAVVERTQLEAAGVPPVRWAGQNVLDEEADIAAAKDQVDRQASGVAGPPALESASESGIGLRGILVLVKHHEQRTGCGHARQVGKCSIPV